MKVFLIGSMGSGKTTIGQLLARKLNLPLYDMDKIIEDEQGESITCIFKSRGEDYFRTLESIQLQRMVNLGSGIISTGGGIVLEKNNRDLLLNERCVIHFQVSVSNQLARLKKDNSRPLLDVENKLKKLQELKMQRDPLYNSVTKYRVNTDTLQVMDVFNTTMNILTEMMTDNVDC
jgi:shikimate kinase